MNVRLAIFSLLAFAAVTRGANFATNDGLEISVDDKNAVQSIRLDGKALALAADSSIFHVRDAGTKSAAAGLKVQATFTANGPYLQVDGSVTDETNSERAVDLKCVLPIRTDGFKLAQTLDSTTPKKKKRNKQPTTAVEVDEAASTGDALFPVCPVSGEAAGLSLAVPPTHPTRFVVGMEGGGSLIQFRIGLSQSSAQPGVTPFRFIIYRHDPQWGFRSSLARYYEFFREPYYTSQAKRIGVWTSQTASHRRAPEFAAYHEAGFGTWRTPGGTESGVNVPLTTKLLDEGPICDSLEAFEQICELKGDEEAKVYSLPYTIVGQRQILKLPELPKNFDDAMKVLESWSTTQPVLFDGPPQALCFRSADELKSIIKSSGIHDEQHRLTTVARPYRGPTLTFPTNPSPHLFRDTDAMTVGKFELDYYVPMMLSSKYVDGVYVDSLGRWCGFMNFRREHFKYSTMPLTYAGTPPQPCIWNLQSHAEYLAELSKRLHEKGKIVIANGVHPTRVMLGAFVDVMGCEGTPTYDAGEDFYARRIAAGPKPYCFLNATGKSSEKLWASCLYMGYLLNASSPAGEPLMRKYDPVIIKLNEARWQPVTQARADRDEVGIERWGARMFTVMNRSKEPVETKLSFEKFGPDAKLIDMLSGENVGRQLRLAPEQTIAFEVE